MLREILTQSLKKHHRQAGLYLEEDDDFVYLKKGDKALKVFSSKGVTFQDIWEEADKYVNTTWAVSDCPICGQSYQHLIKYKPSTCGKYECLHKWLHPELYKNRPLITDGMEVD